MKIIGGLIALVGIMVVFGAMGTFETGGQLNLLTTIGGLSAIGLGGVIAR